MDHLSLSSKQIQGGAPNNFTILSKSVNPYIHHVEVKEQPRIPGFHEPSKPNNSRNLFSLAPANIGPGSYSKKAHNPKKETSIERPVWGNEKRF